MHQASLADQIHFHGRVPPEQLQPPLLQRSQAILLMSDFVGLPVALLEAIAAGVVPVVRAIESGIPELLHHERTGLLVGNDPAEAAAALVRLSNDPDLWERCSSQARALMQVSYCAGYCFERWLHFFQCEQNWSCRKIHVSINMSNSAFSLDDLRFSASIPTLNRPKLLDDPEQTAHITRGLWPITARSYPQINPDPLIHIQAYRKCFSEHFLPASSMTISIVPALGLSVSFSQ